MLPITFTDVFAADISVMSVWDSRGIYFGGSASQHFASAYLTPDRYSEYGLYIKIKVYAVSTVSREQFALEAVNAMSGTRPVEQRDTAELRAITTLYFKCKMK